ncbi:probable disease resistance protein At5g43730 [Vigna radiata var. radiata]|uniref:Probable disease resistance protein At5g43730 n=1 Tax=Vigna radiata var. radiata TaxID=3916 RepID=A0A1S3TSY2_VIGRR|nr:probable disease resistance protein At5g43730 [Vigna radiata var. radiata]
MDICNEAESGNTAITLQRNLDEFISNLKREEDDLKQQLQYLKSRGKKHKRVVDEWFDKLQNMKQRAMDMKNSLNESGWPNFNVQGEIRDLIKEMKNHKKCKPMVLSNEFVGKKFERNVKKMWKFLQDDRVFIIGIYGKGGVGKTFLATYIQSEIKRSKVFENVLWVTLSHDFNIFKLQEYIAKQIKVNLCEYDDENSRAIILESELGKGKNTIIILDNIWKYIDLAKVGIPLGVGVKGIKVVMTSRLRHVCQEMQCLSDNMIEVGVFYDDEYEEAWELFLLGLQHFGTPPKLSPQVRDIARCVVSKCDGLPLAIRVMARTMRGKTSIHEWRYALNKFDKWEMGVTMREEVLTVLRRSYDNLAGMKKRFLHSALLPKFFVKEDLIMMMVDMGLLNGDRSLKEIFDEGNDIVNELINHSLLLEHDSILRMQGLVKKMAWDILKENNANMMLKCNQYMRNIYEILEWSTDLETVSLANNSIEEIPYGTSPYCPRLSTLLLFDNSIGHIPESFFTYMNALKTFGLSEKHNLTCLPRSLSNVRSLTSLMLHECSKLNDIPPLGELRSLLRLQISGCSIQALPEGLKNLINLKWLDLSNNVNLELVLGSFLSSLTNIQYLNLWICSGGIKVEDVKRMTMLECFAGTFVDKDNLNRYVREILDNGNGPQTYLIHYLDWKQNGRKMPLWGREYRLSTFMCRTMSFRDCKELSHVLPRDLMKLLLDCNNHWVCVCDALSSNDSSPLEEICIRDWTKLTSLFCSSCSLCTRIRNFQSLKLDYLESLTTIFKELPSRDRKIELLTEVPDKGKKRKHLKNFRRLLQGIKTQFLQGIASNVYVLYD